jgi:hypothetical protein
MKTKALFATPLLLLLSFTTAGFASSSIPDYAQAKKTQQIAEEAFIYGFPMIMNYTVMYTYAVDANSGQYKAPFNQIANASKLFTPKDTAIITPNSDTPYSIVWMDLRAEPIVLCVPEVEKGRYYTLQLIDMYTSNYGYIGSRATGNGAGCYMIAGPDWKGQPPQNIKKAFRCESQFSSGIYRTQLFGPTDIDNVKRVQAGYKVQTLSQFLNQPPPTPAPRIQFPKIDKALAKADPFAYLNFVLQFCPPVPQERAVRAKFASIGIAAGKPFDVNSLSLDQKASVLAGMKSGMERIEKKVVALGTDVDGWRSGLNSGDRAFYHNDWLLRAGVALAGIYANDAVEALYPWTHTDSTGAPLNGSASRYTITFAAGQLPPVNAFWSVTMYDGKSQLLVDNPLNRYLINSPMLANLKKNDDGSSTLYVQKNSPGADKESNWLPSPDDTFYMVMRLYWPKQAALDGKWRPPVVQKIQ